MKILLVIAIVLMATAAYAADVTIKNVPEGAEAKVKSMAMIAIERFIKARDVKVAEEITTKFESDIDTIRVANSLNKKFEVVKK